MENISKIEEYAALQSHDSALNAAEEYSKTHSHSIVEEVAYGRGIQIWIYTWCKGVHGKVCQFVERQDKYPLFC